MILAIVLVLAKGGDADLLGPHPAQFSSKQFGIHLLYPADWKIDTSKPRTAEPAGEFLRAHSGEDILVFEASTKERPLSLIQVRVSPGAKSDFDALVRGHPHWWVNPYPVETAGSSVDASWRMDSDPSMVGGQKAIVTDVGLGFWYRSGIAETFTLQADFQDPSGRVFRFLGACEDISLKPGPKNVVSTGVPVAEAEAFRHKQMVLFRQILRTIAFGKSTNS